MVWILSRLKQPEDNEIGARLLTLYQNQYCEIDHRIG